MTENPAREKGTGVDYVVSGAGGTPLSVRLRGLFYRFESVKRQERCLISETNIGKMSRQTIVAITAVWNVSRNMRPMPVGWDTRERAACDVAEDGGATMEDEVCHGSYGRCGAG